MVGYKLLLLLSLLFLLLSVRPRLYFSAALEILFPNGLLQIFADLLSLAKQKQLQAKTEALPCLVAGISQWVSIFSVLEHRNSVSFVLIPTSNLIRSSIVPTFLRPSTAQHPTDLLCRYLYLY